MSEKSTSPRILIVEDDFIIQMFFDKVIHDLGFVNAGMYNNGEKALSRIEEKKPDLILLDSGIRGPMDGIEVAHIINEKYKIPFVFITGNTDKKTYDRILESKPLRILKKPVNSAVLKNELRKIFESLE